MFTDYLLLLTERHFESDPKVDPVRLGPRVKAFLKKDTQNQVLLGSFTSTKTAARSSILVIPQ